MQRYGVYLYMSKMCSLPITKSGLKWKVGAFKSIFWWSGVQKCNLKLSTFGRYPKSRNQTLKFEPSKASCSLRDLGAGHLRLVSRALNARRCLPATSEEYRELPSGAASRNWYAFGLQSLLRILQAYILPSIFILTILRGGKGMLILISESVVWSKWLEGNCGQKYLGQSSRSHLSKIPKALTRRKIPQKIPKAALWKLLEKIRLGQGKLLELGQRSSLLSIKWTT